MNSEQVLSMLKTNVNEHTEKKNGLTYLSWAWAWAEALKADPEATYKIEMFEGKPFVDINGTAMVFVTVTMFGKPMTCQLPVMDYRNKAIPSPDAFAVNTAIMRCMTKAVALHGLGLYIYAGEDLPESDEKTPPSTEVEAPKPIVRQAKKLPQPTEWDNSDESRKLFADGMIEWTNHCNSVAGLNSYWKSNELQLDSLKETHPPLYEGVLTHFKSLKKQLTEKPNE